MGMSVRTTFAVDRLPGASPHGTSKNQPCASADENFGAGVDAGTRRTKIDAQQSGVECLRTMLTALSGDDLTLGEVLNLVALQVMKWLGPNCVLIGTMDSAAQTLNIHAAQGSHAGVDIQELLPSGLQALRCALATQGPVLFPEGGCLATADDASEVHPTVLVVPLQGAGDLSRSGVLLYYATPPRLSPMELELAALLGTQAALAIQRAEEKARDHAIAVMGERNRIARDLHDSVMQALYTMSLITESLPEVWWSHHEEALQGVETLCILARSALAEMRALLLELRPLDQADRNLGDLLRQLPDRMFRRSSVQITTTVVGNTPLPKHVQVALYYIAQEALNNVDKHARATRASIQLEFQLNGAVMLRISDNGCGIDPGRRHANWLGLGIMQERASEIDAALNIESQPGQGTQITVEWHAG